MDTNRQTLTRQFLDKLRAGKAPRAPYRVWDAKVPALFVRVQPSGVLSFNVQWSRTSSKGLGKYPTTTLEGARVRALEILADASKAPDGVPKAARPKSAAEATTLRAFAAGDYKAWARANLDHGEAAVARLLRVFAKLADKPLGELTHKAIEGVLTSRANKGCEAATINRDLGTIKAALAKAVEWKVLDANPATGIPARKVKDGVVRFLDANEERALLAALDARDAAARASRARTIAGGRSRDEGLQPIPEYAYSDHLTPLVLTALHTGCRRGELLALRWQDVDLKAKRLTVRGATAKNAKTRHVPLNRAAVDALTRWKQGDGAGRVFSVANVKTAWAALLDVAEIEEFRFHDLRHTFASKLVMAGVDLNTVRELLGHGDIKMTLRYAHLAPEHKAAAVELLVS